MPPHDRPHPDAGSQSAKAPGTSHPPARETVVERTTLLPASPTSAFTAVNSPEIAPSIDPAVREWSPDSDPISVGTRFTIRGRLGVLPIRGTSEVVTWEPPHVATYRSIRPSWPFRMTAEHRFESDGANGCRYTWSITFVEVHALGRPVIALARRLFERALANQAQALHAYLVGDDRPSG